MPPETIFPLSNKYRLLTAYLKCSHASQMVLLIPSPQTFYFSPLFQILLNDINIHQLQKTPLSPIFPSIPISNSSAYHYKLQLHNSNPSIYTAVTFLSYPNVSLRQQQQPTKLKCLVSSILLCNPLFYSTVGVGFLAPPTSSLQTFPIVSEPCWSSCFSSTLSHYLLQNLYLYSSYCLECSSPSSLNFSVLSLNNFSLKGPSIISLPKFNFSLTLNSSLSGKNTP